MTHIYHNGLEDILFVCIFWKRVGKKDTPLKSKKKKDLLYVSSSSEYFLIKKNGSVGDRPNIDISQVGPISQTIGQDKKWPHLLSVGYHESMLIKYHYDILK